MKNGDKLTSIYFEQIELEIQYYINNFGLSREQAIQVYNGVLFI